MEITISARGTGKTYNLIKRSAREGFHIVCQNHSISKALEEKAKTLGLEIPTPITYDSFRNHKYHGKKITGFLIDNVDLLLQEMSIFAIEEITLTTTK